MPNHRRTLKPYLVAALLWVICFVEAVGRGIRFVLTVAGGVAIVLARAWWRNIRTPGAAQVFSIACLLVLGVMTFTSSLGSLNFENAAGNYVRFWMILGFVGFGVVGFDEKLQWLYRLIGLEKPEPAKAVPISAAKGRRR